MATQSAAVIFGCTRFYLLPRFRLELGGVMSIWDAIHKWAIHGRLGQDRPCSNLEQFSSRQQSHATMLFPCSTHCSYCFLISVTRASITALASP